MAVDRVDLESIPLGKQKTFYIGPVTDHEGEHIPTTGTFSGLAYKPTAYTTTVTPTFAIANGKQGRYCTVLLSAADLDTAGTWLLNVYMAPSGGNAEGIVPWAFRFQVYGLTT